MQKIKVSRKKYFNVKIPNAMFEVGLTAYCIAVYVHLKKVTQDEDCCKLSMLMFILQYEAKQPLENV